MKVLGFLYGVASYVVFLAVFLYAIAFVSNLPVPKTLDSGEAGPLGAALLVNVLLASTRTSRSPPGPCTASCATRSCWGSSSPSGPRRT
jgi:hypothetical protein